MHHLDPGQVLVTMNPSGEPSIAKESDLVLLDRSFQPGDVVKRSVEDAQSGVILKSNMKVRLGHAISGVKLPGWYSIDDFVPYYLGWPGMYVVHQNWIGQVGSHRAIPLNSAQCLVYDRSWK